LFILIIKILYVVSMALNIPNLPMPIRDKISNFYPPNTAAVTLGFDIDNSIFDKSKFLSAMETLYHQLAYDDFNRRLVGDFWQSYMDLHIDKHQNT